RLAGLDSPLLDESSGVSFFNDQLWTHVDNTNSVIYRLDSATGLSTQEISIVNTVNTDWEDITEGNGFVFLGDFGNNYGNRTDLRIYRVEQSQFSDTSTVLVADTILFSYPDQTDFTPALNATRFDCEAFFYREDSLHLFCKDWVNKGTRHYVVPAIPGTHVAALRDSFNVNGLVTSAAVASDGAIVLLGYDNVVPAPCFLWLLYDYSGTDFFSGNKRMFSLGTALTAGQVEGVCFRNNHYGYITNERFQQFVFNIEPQLWSYDLGTFISSPITAVQDTKPQPQELSTSPNPFTTETIVQLPANLLQGSVFFLVSPDGKIIREEKIYGNEFHIQRQSLVSGIYFYRVIQPDGVVYQGKVIPD
ncbi:MAG TPA: T9SS type A sorting domain-containing protein, partial [Bacteroidia bacterium]|nr:T9SS type A sorting domain-containing protein [Bacteroidia bacterium]